MKLPKPKVLIKGFQTGLRKNRTKISGIAAVVNSMITAKLAFNAGERVAERKAEKENLTDKDIRDITIGELGGVIVSEISNALIIGGLCLSADKSTVAGLAVAEYMGHRNRVRAAKASDACAMPQPEKLSDKKFDVVEYYTGTKIKKVTPNKLMYAEYMCNKQYELCGYVRLEYIVKLLGGKLPEEYERSIEFNFESFFEGKDEDQCEEFTPFMWLSFDLTYDDDIGEIVLGYTIPAQYDGNDENIEKQVSRAVKEMHDNPCMNCKGT